MKIKEKLKAHASKIAAAVTGGAVMIAGAVPAFAEGVASDTMDLSLLCLLHLVRLKPMLFL